MAQFMSVEKMTYNDIICMKRYGNLSYFVEHGDLGDVQKQEDHLNDI